MTLTRTILVINPSCLIIHSWHFGHFNAAPSTVDLQNGQILFAGAFCSVGFVAGGCCALALQNAHCVDSPWICWPHLRHLTVFATVSCCSTSFAISCHDFVALAWGTRASKPRSARVGFLSLIQPDSNCGKVVMTKGGTAGLKVYVIGFTSKAGGSPRSGGRAVDRAVAS